MIKFFRKIRYQLLGEGKTGKYVKYAVGEIVLVVIGILIALSINNWNTKRLEKIEERSYLERLLVDLKQDLVEAEIVTKNNQRRLYQCKITLDSLEAYNIPYDSLNFNEWTQELKIDTTGMLNLTFGNGLTRIRMYDEFNVNDDTYQELLANGKINLITNEKIKISVLNYYSYLDNKLQLVQKIEMMRDHYVNTLAEYGISMYNNMSKEKFGALVGNKKNLVAEIENIFYITWVSQFAIKFDDDSIVENSRELIEQIEDFLLK